MATATKDYKELSLDSDVFSSARPTLIYLCRNCLKR